MKKGILAILATMMVCLVNAQLTLKTIVTQGPVVAGESFQVQYVFEADGPEADFFQPEFRHFKVVSGPNAYRGVAFGENGPVKVKNITFTLVALKEGAYTIPGASIKLQGQLIRSQPAPLQVISRASAIARGIIAEKNPSVEGSYLAPGEDPVEKMRKNIFMKVSVDRKKCYVGQPVTATFKLYSRLNSRSDIVKNPGFYGFAIQDMIGLTDNVTETEMVNGKPFEVHTIRKVQLYPLSAGTLTIDPMEVQNKVEFSTSSVSKKTEQEIVEGVIPGEDELFSKPGFKLGETSMRTEPVTVKVNALPDTNKPVSFNGATGKFRVSATLEHEEVGANREGDLLVTVSGKGNFLQMAAPVINWPASIEGFSAEIKDTINKQLSPFEGKRIFRFRFVSTKPGKYTIPAISFSFFDPDSNRYRVVATEPLTVTIRDSLNAVNVPGPTVTINKNVFPFLAWTGVALAVCLIIFFLVRIKSNSRKKELPVEASAAEVKTALNELLQPATILIQADEISFYTALRNAIWNFAAQNFDLTGSSMSKRGLQQALTGRGILPVDQQVLLNILDECEAGMFTGAASSPDRQQLLDETKEIMRKIERMLN